MTNAPRKPTKPEADVATLLDRVAQIAIRDFMRSSYPRAAVDFRIEGVFDWHVRIPPTLPFGYVSRFTDVMALMRAVPAIERINVNEAFRRQGLFGRLLIGLSRVPGVQAIAVTNTINSAFASSLHAKCEEPGSGWRTLEGGFFPCFLDEASKAS